MTTHHPHRIRTLGWLAAAWLTGLPAAAVDGVREINQSCAAVGCWPGDDPGLPVQILDRGSYRLTSGLTLVDENATGILVDADDVAIDLNGFTIRGPVVVTKAVGQPPQCSASGGGIGIDGVINGSGVRNAVVNGSVVGTGASGILVGVAGRIERVSVESTCGWGIFVGEHGSIVDSRARLVPDEAVFAGRGSRVAGVLAELSYAGIGTGAASTVSSSVAIDNYHSGVAVGIGSVVSDSTVSENDGDGIWSGSGVIVVTNNMILGNGGWGVFVSSSSTGFGGNVFSGNGSGGINLGVPTQCNVFNGTSICPPHP